MTGSKSILAIDKELEANIFNIDPSHEQTLAKALEWLIQEVKREGVEIKLNTKFEG